MKLYLPYRIHPASNPSNSRASNSATGERTYRELLGVFLTAKLADQAIINNVKQTAGTRYETDIVLLDTGGEPIFVLRAQDELAPGTIWEYLKYLSGRKLIDQYNETREALREFTAWQSANQHRVKLPDHKHIPAEG